ERAGAVADQLAEEPDGEDRAGGPPRMPESQRTALRADPCRVQPELVTTGEDLAGEGLVELDHVEVVEGEAGAIEHRPHGRHDPDAGSVRRDTGGGRGEHAEAGDV